MADKANIQDVENVTQSQLDIFDGQIIVPASKLDADQYAAEDLDGVTESIFGSGNMNFLSLQAGQTDEAIAISDPFSLSDSNIPDQGLAQQERGGQINTDRPLNAGNAEGIQGLGTEGNFTNSTVGSLGASTLSSDVGSFSPQSNLSVNGKNIFGSRSNASSNSSQSNNNENNVEGDTTTNTEENIDNSVTDNTVNEGDTFIDNVFEGDDIVENVTNTVTDITNNVFNDVLGGEISLDLVTDVLGTVGLDLGATIGDSIEGTISVEAVADNVTAIVDDLTGIDLPLDILGGLDIGFDLLNNADELDGNDIIINGLNIPDIQLNFLEDIVGDIDIELTIPTELADLGATVDMVGDVLGQLGDIDLANPGEILGIVGDQGLDGTLDAVLGQFELNEVFGGDLGDIVDDITGDLGLGDLGLGDIGALGDNEIVNALDDVVDDVNEVVGDVLGDALDGLGLAGDGGLIEEVLDLAGDVVAPVDDIIGDVQDIVEDVLDNPGEAVQDILENPEEALDIAAEVVEDTVDAITDGLGDALGDLAGGEVLDDIIGDLAGGEVLEDVVGDLAGGEILEDIVGGLGDGEVIEDIMDGLGNGGLGDIVEDVVAGAGDLLDGVTGGATEDITDTLEDVVGDVLDGGGLEDVGGAVEEIVDGLGDGGLDDIVDDIIGGGDGGGLFGGLFGSGDNDNDGGADSDITANADLDILDTGIIDPIIDVVTEPVEDLVIDPVEDLIGDLDLDLGLGLDLLGGNETDNDAGDQDIVLETDIDLVDDSLAAVENIIELDPIEELVGDIDLDLGLGADILGGLADPIVNDGEGGTGEDTVLADIGDVLGDLVGGIAGPLLGDTEINEIGGLDLLNGEDSDNDAGDSDLVIDLDGDALGLDILDINEDIPLDPVEAIVGDIDLDVGDALDLLDIGGLLGGDDAAEEIDDIETWTESVISDGGGLFGDLIGGALGGDLGGGAGDVLPEVVGTVAEGLGVLDVEPELDVGGLFGGLFG